MTTPETAAEIREQLRGMALSLATGSGPLVEPAAFDAALDAYRDAVLAEEPAVSSAVVAPPTGQAAAEAALAAVETALGDTLAADAREEALAGIAAVLPPTDQAAGLREADWVVEHCPEHGCVEPSTEVCHCEIADRLRRRPAAVLPEPADRAAVLRWAADRIDATRADFPIAVQNGITWATAEMRRHAADEQPGARHVHITIHHPDPTTATTAALCIADLVRGEYSDSHRLTITTDAQDTGGSPRRLADETATTQTQPASTAPLAAGLPLVKGNCPACGGSSLFLGNGGYVTCSRIDCPEPDAASTTLEQPAAGARQDGAQP